MSISHSVPTSWASVHDTLRDLAEAERGVTTLSAPGTDPETWPRTTGCDALAVVSVFDGAAHVHLTGDLAERWDAVTDRLGRESLAVIEDTYAGNRSLWSTLPFVAAALDHCGAALPNHEDWDTAVRELMSDHRSACVAALTRAVPVQFPIVESWEELAKLQLRFFAIVRGAEHVDGPLLAQIPLTTNADVLQLATFWTEELLRFACPDDMISRYARSRWTTAVENVDRLAKGAPPHAIYTRNAELWRSLVALTLQIGTFAGPPAAWTLHIEALYPQRRNAVTDGPGGAFVVDFKGATTWDDAARILRDELAKRRGEDLVEGDLIRRVPRTTNHDVRQLADYWDRLLSRAGTHHRDISARRVLDRWRAAIADVAALTKGAEPGAVYPRNLDFWRALMTIAIQIAVTKEAPSRLTLMGEATRHGLSALPDTLSDAAAWVASRAAEVPGKIAGGLRDLLWKPLMIGAGGILGLLLLVRAVRNDRRRDRDDRRPDRNDRSGT